MEIIQCDVCGAPLNEQMKQSELSYKCPYCGGVSYKTPDFEFFKNAVKKYTGNLNTSIEISLMLGKYDDEADEALQTGDFEKALEAKVKSISVYAAMVPGLNSDKQKEDFYTVEIHKFKQEFISEKGRYLHIQYIDAVKKENLDDAVRFLIELEKYKISGCSAGEQTMIQCRRSIIDAARNFLNGQADASKEEKERISEKYGLHKGILKTEEGYICPACGAFIKEEDIIDDFTKCPYCDNIFKEAGTGKMTEMLSGFSRTEIKSENISAEDFEELKNEILGDSDLDADFSFSLSMMFCPHCGNMIGFEPGKKTVCPHCKKETDC